MKPHNTDRTVRKTGAAQTVVALFRMGGGRCRLAAAFVAVMVGFVGQTATQAFAQAEETFLYLDAPAVSTDRATRAGETASAYSDPRSSASPDTLAWLGIRGLRGDETGAPSQDASEAFASVTAPDARGTPSVTAKAAYDAGATMLAQIEDGAPPEDGVPGEEELAATGAVRPELGDGTQAPKGEPSAGYVAAPAEQPTIPDLASSPEPVVPVSEPIQEPSGGEGLALEAPASAPAPTELAAAPTDDASPAPGISPDTEPDYGATGPISEPAAEPAPTAESSTEPGVQEREVQEQEVQQPEIQDPEVQEPVSPSGGSEAAVLETPDSPEPGASPAASVETSASPEPVVEPSAAPTAERVEEPEDGSEEFAGASTTPVAGPEPADRMAHGGPAAAPDTGPTRDQSDDDALAPASSPTPEDDGDSDGPVSASPTPEEAGWGDASVNASRVQISEVVVVQETDTGEGANSAASPPPDFAPPTDEAENGGAEDTGPPSWAPLHDDTEPETAPPTEPTAEQSAGEGAEEGDAIPSEAPNERPPEQTDLGYGETATSSPADDAEEPALDTLHGTGPEDEGTAGVPGSPSSEEAPPTGGDQEGSQDTSQDLGSGEAPTERPMSPGVTPSGDPQALPDTTEQALPPGGNVGTNGPRPQADDPAGGSDRGPDRSREDHKDDSRDRRHHGHSRAASPDERLRRIRQDDGGAGTAQEKAREATGRSGSGGGQQSVKGFQGEESPRARAPELPASITPRADDALGHRKSAQDRPQRILRSPVSDLDGAHEPATAPPEQAGNPSRPEPLVEQQAEAEQAAVEGAVREQRRRNRPTEGEALDAQGHVAPSTGRRRNVPDHQETVAQPAGVELAPARQVKTQRFAPVEQPAAVELAPAQQVPAARLAPAAHVQPQAQPQVQQQPEPDGVGQVGGGSVARATKSVNRAAGR